MNLFAFFGTGECDPNKGLMQFLAFAGVAAGWWFIAFLVRKLKHSKQGTAVKVIGSVLLVGLGIIGTGITFLAVWLGLACSG